MNNQDYWAKREDEALKHYITDEKEYDKQIERIYQTQFDNIQKEIDSFYGKYASKEGISIAEAKKRVSDHDVKAFERKAKKYVEEKNFSKTANEELRLYNATMRINRLEMLKANIGLELIAGGEELEKFMGGILKGRTEDELKRQAGILGKTIKNNAQLAHTIPNASFHNATFSDRIWMNQDLLKSELSKLLQTGMIQGKNPRVLARELKKTFDTSTYNAERLMRTELARVQTEAQKQSFERNGFEQYTFLANSGCCDICQGLNGKHFKVADMMPGENAAPLHPHCRCSTAAYEDSKEYEEWLDYLANGGTTEEYNKIKLTNNVKSGRMSLPKEMGKQSEKTFAESVKGQYKIDDVERELSNAFENGTSKARAAFRKYTDNNSLATWNSKDGNYHQGGKVYLNALKSINDPRGIKVAYYHEFGHLIDYKARGNSTRLSMTSAKFGELIRSDVKKYIENYQEKNGTFGAYRKISEEFRSNDKAVRFHAVSDIFDGVTNGQIVGKYGHSQTKGYWQKTGAIEGEAFAHMYQAQFDKEEYALMQQYFPNALKEFEKLLEGVS